jgi:hypothetical protein
MEQSENIAEISAALSKAQAEIRNPGKNTKNTFFKNEYADLTAVLGCIRPVASAHELTFIQGVEAYNGNVAVTSQISHSSGQWIKQIASVSLPAQSKNPIQDLGSMATYLKRYQAQSMWAICADEDTDAQDLTIGIENISENQTVNHSSRSLTSKALRGFLKINMTELLSSFKLRSRSKSNEDPQRRTRHSGVVRS